MSCVTPEKSPKVYTSRYANPVLRSGEYTAVRISLGTPKWNLGYSIDYEFYELMPFGLLGKYSSQEEFEPSYFARLEEKGVDRIGRLLDSMKRAGKDVVLLCYEDIRKGPEYWCHRRAFAKWWNMKTGVEIPELPEAAEREEEPPKEWQMSLF